MASSTSAATYWDEYSNLQRTKHELIRQYLNGWFPKLASWSGRVLYFDTHAGRGRHNERQLGSPLIALKTLLEHASRPQLLSQSEAIFYFIERDDENVAALHEELKAFEPLPPKVTVKTISGDCFEAIENLLESLDQSQGRLAPAFVFVDPFGFKVPGSLLRRLMEHKRVELFINVMWRELDMAIQQGDKPGMAATLDLIANAGGGEQVFEQCSAFCSLLTGVPSMSDVRTIRVFSALPGDVAVERACVGWNQPARTHLGHPQRMTGDPTLTHRCESSGERLPTEFHMLRTQFEES